MSDWLQLEFLGNTVRQYLYFGGILTVVMLLRGPSITLLVRVLNRLFHRIAPIDGPARLGILVRAPLSWLLLLFGLFAAGNVLDYPAILERQRFGISLLELLLAVYKLTLIVVVTWLLMRIVEYLTTVLRERASTTETKQDDQAVVFIRESLRVVLYVLAIFLVLGNVFGLDISSLLAGAGLAGLAVALAAQDSLRNLLGSLTIFSEKPYTVGDTIEIAGNIGTVEKVGFRSTTLRSPDKTRIMLPNKFVVDQSLNNLSDRPLRRVFFMLRLQYGLTPGALRAIVGDIRALLRADDQVAGLPAVAFEGFQPDALEIRVDYDLRLFDWQEFLRRRERLHFAVMEILERNGAAFSGASLNVQLDSTGVWENKDRPKGPTL